MGSERSPGDGETKIRGSGRTIDCHWLIMNDPIVVESRTKMGPAAEQRPTQKVIILFMVLPGIALFIVTDLYQRFGWSSGRSGLS
jgi:hypothetical protein